MIILELKIIKDDIWDYKTHKNNYLDVGPMIKI